MKTGKHLLIALFVLIGLSAAIIGCKKPEPVVNPVSTTPTITGVNPATATAGSSVTITGTNLSNATVTIGGVSTTIGSASSATQIVVTLPTSIPVGTATVVVSTTAGTAQSMNPLTVALAPAKPTKSVTGTTFANLRWTKDTIYLLKGMMYIPANYTLTIDPGTIIKGTGPDQDPLNKSMPGTLVVEKLGKIIAQGTAAQPIVFTSVKAVNQRNYGDWGGIVLVGKAPINRPSTTPNPAGVRGTVDAYGEPADNSGVLQYVRIEYAGALQPGATTKLSGLSLYGVGTGTTIDHVQVSYSGSDAFSWFGGTANVKNIFAYRTYDDDWSVDWGYVGNVQFGAALRDPAVADQSGSNGLELENYESTLTADVPVVTIINGLTKNVPIFANLSNFAYSTTTTTATTSKGTGPYRAGLFLRRNSAIAVYNSVFYGYPEGLHVEAVSTPSGITNGLIDLKGVVLANSLTPIAIGGGTSSDLITSYFMTNTRSNQIVSSSDAPSLLLNDANFTLAGPIFTLKSTSSLLGGAVTGGLVGANSFFTSVGYRGAFGADNWLSGWANYNPQTTDYDR